MWHEIVRVHLEGETEILFTIPPPARPLREGDTIRYENGGDPITYKVESVDYLVKGKQVNANPDNNSTDFVQPETTYGVSIANP